jgi:hypothetical protein
VLEERGAPDRDAPFMRLPDYGESKNSFLFVVRPLTHAQVLRRQNFLWTGETEASHRDPIAIQLPCK